MRIFFIWLFLSASLYSFAQRKERHNVGSMDGFYGKPVYQQSFSSLNSVSDFNFSKPPEFFGISFSAQVTSNKYSDGGQPAQFFFGIMVSEKIYLHDTLPLDLNGYIVGMTIFAYDFLYKSKSCDLTVGTGFNTGRIRISNTEMKQRNSLLAPKVNFGFKAAIKKISIGFQAEYMFDISDKEWQKLHFSKTEITPVTPFRQSGYFIKIMLGKAF